MTSHKDKKASYEDRLKRIQLKKNEARLKNYDAVIKEGKNSKLPPNYEAKKARAEWELQKLNQKEQILATNQDYDQFLRLQETVTSMERREYKEMNSKNPDLGFADYATAQLRQYNRLTKNLKPDLRNYERLKQKIGDDIFPDSNSLTVYSGTNIPLDVKRMTSDLEKQILVRGKYRRRRQYYEDKDVDFINEKNKQFNETTERAYGKYTEKLKDNLERGTAL